MKQSFKKEIESKFLIRSLSILPNVTPLNRGSRNPLPKVQILCRNQSLKTQPIRKQRKSADKQGNKSRKSSQKSSKSNSRSKSPIKYNQQVKSKPPKPNRRNSMSNQLQKLADNICLDVHKTQASLSSSVIINPKKKVKLKKIVFKDRKKIEENQNLNKSKTMGGAMKMNRSDFDIQNLNKQKYSEVRKEGISPLNAILRMHKQIQRNKKAIKMMAIHRQQERIVNQAVLNSFLKQICNLRYSLDPDQIKRFQQLRETLKKHFNYYVILELFKLFDRDGDGLLSTLDMFVTLQQCQDPDITEQAIVDIFMEAPDVDQKGRLNFEAFFQLLIGGVIQLQDCKYKII